MVPMNPLAIIAATLCLSLPAWANPEEEKSAPATEAQPGSVHDQVAKLAKKHFPEGFEKAIVAPDKTGEAWTIQVNVFDADHSAAALQKSIIALAAECHPEGMSVSSFEVAAWADFEDGLGNTNRRGLVRAKLRPGIAAKVNWKRPLEIDFHTAFATEFVHPAFKEKWADSALF